MRALAEVLIYGRQGLQSLGRRKNESNGPVDENGGGPSGSSRNRTKHRGWGENLQTEFPALARTRERGYYLSSERRAPTTQERGGRKGQLLFGFLFLVPSRGWGGIGYRLKERVGNCP